MAAKSAIEGDETEVGTMRNTPIAIAIATFGLLGPAGPGQADSVSSMSRSQIFASQLAVLDGRAAQQYSDSVRLQPDRDPGGNLPYTGSYNGPYLGLAREAATRHGVPGELFLRLVQQESGWNPAAVSAKGAVGLAQLMPETAARLGADPTDPTQNLDAGARYLRQQYEAFGTWPLALAAYNAGPEVVRQYGGIPPYPETQSYVTAIWGS